jgi:hypothetical protein
MFSDTALAEPIAAFVSRKCSTISSRRRSFSLRRKFRAFCSSWIALSISARESPLIRSRGVLTSEGTAASIFGVALTRSRFRVPWTLMRKYRDLAEHAEPPFLGDFYRKVAERYRRMAKEALDLANAEARRKN